MITRDFLVSGKWKPGYSYFKGYTPGSAVFQAPVAPSASITRADVLAKRKFFKKVAETRKAFDGGVFLGELRETIRMLRNPAKALFDSARVDYLGKLKKLKNVDPGNWKRGLRGTWLESSYGWLPFINDTKNAYDAFERSSESAVARRMIVGVGFDEPSCVVTESSDSDLAAGITLWVTKTALQSVKIKYKGLYKRDFATESPISKSAELAHLWGFTPSEFIPTVWELLPWSFLVDYFSNVGNILEQSFTSFDDIRWVNKSTVLESSETIISRPNLSRMIALADSPPSRRWNTILVRDNGMLYVRRIAFSRTRESPSPESLTFELPGRPQQWLNIGALWSQANDIHPQRFRMRR